MHKLEREKNPQNIQCKYLYQEVSKRTANQTKRKQRVCGRKDKDECRKH